MIQPNFHISALSCIIGVIVIAATVALYYTKRSSFNDVFSKILTWSVGFMLFHSLTILFIELFFGQERWIDRLAPFSLVYGPILYFSFTAIRNRTINGLTILLHLAPAISFTIIYLFLLLNVIPSTIENQHTMLRYMTIVSPTSFASYTIWSIFAGRHIVTNRMRGKTFLFIFGRVLLLFAAMLSVAASISNKLKGNEQAAFFIRASIYSCMIVCLLVIIYYAHNKITRKQANLNSEPGKIEESKATIPKYEKSALTQQSLSDYELRLRKIMEEKKLYLINKLTLNSLAKQLKIPAHHLTQVFSSKIKLTFYQYINALRVQEACKKLSDPNQEYTIEALAAACGFNSKVSFNRNFKEITGKTPSQFRDDGKFLIR